MELPTQTEQKDATTTAELVAPLDTTEFIALSIDDVEHLIDECIPPELASVN